MSMISAQCDELRLMARLVRDYDYKEISRMLRRAADTIWELRNKLAGTVDQSEEIKKRTAELDFQIADNWRLTAVSESLKEQNAKLRELCTDIWNDALHFEGFWDYVHDDGTIYREDELPHYQERMRECGIEVSHD